MIQVIGFVPKEADPKNVQDLFDLQIESMKKSEGCLFASLSKGPIMTPNGPSKYQLVLTANWKSLEDFHKWASSEEQHKKMNDLREMNAELSFFEIFE